MKLGTEIGLNYDSAIGKLKILFKYKVIITYVNLLESQSGKSRESCLFFFFYFALIKGLPFLRLFIFCFSVN